MGKFYQFLIVICPGYDSGKVFNIVSRFYLEIIILHHISD